MITASQITKELKKSGFNKASFSRVDFQNIPTGSFETKQMNKFGLSCVIVIPKNGSKAEQFQSALKNYNTEVKNGYLIIK